jgi:hypothetical protein
MANTQVFDLGNVSASLNPYRVRKLAGLVAILVFISLFALLFLLALGPGILSGKTTAYKEAVLTIVVVFAIAIGVQGITGLRSVRKGPVSLQLGEEGLVFKFQKRVLIVKWTDSRLELDLYDATNCDPSYVRATPYSVFLNGENYGLTREAFEATLSAARQHGLVERTSIASRWVYAPAATPIVHRFSVPK